jgi:hypothetical protein
VLFVIGALLCVGMALALQNPDVVPRVTVENRSSVPVNVDVRGSSSGSRLILDTVPAGSTATTLDVLDQGNDWIFGFSSGGVDGGSVRVSRAKLADDGWRLVVPDDILQRLQSSEFVPSYR